MKKIQNKIKAKHSFDEEESIYAFGAYIQRTLANHPDWLADALGAVYKGMRQALDTQCKRAKEADKAFLMVLSLLTSKRANKEIINSVSNHIVEYIKNSGNARCIAEEGFIKLNEGVKDEKVD